MTVAESIIAWLKEFDPKEYWKMKAIQTDILPAKAFSYSLVKEPIQNVKTFISGRKQVTGYYCIMARLPSTENDSRTDNAAWGELLEKWVAEQNDSNHFPQIENGTVKKITVTTPFYLGKSETMDSVYQMTVSINYEMEGKTVT